MSLGKSKKKSYETVTETRNVAPASPLERALRDRMNTTAVSQADALEAALRQQQAWEASPAYAALNRIQELSTKNLIDRLSGTAPVISPQAQGYIEQAYAPQIQQNLDLLKQRSMEDYQRRGLTFQDTPVAGQLQQNMAQYLSNVAGSKAGDILKFGQQDADFNRALAEFADKNRQNAQQMRLNLSTANTPGYQFSLGQEQNRINAAPVTRSGTISTRQSMPTGQLLFGNQGLIPALAGPTEKFLTKGVPAAWNFTRNTAVPGITTAWNSIFNQQPSYNTGLNFNTSNWGYM